MDALQIAQVKDDILKYIYKPESIENLVSIEELYTDLDIIEIPLVVLKGYLEEMANESLIKYWEVEEDNNLLAISEDGERLIYNGGFIKQLQDQIAIVQQQEEDRQINRVKTKLEIDNLKLTKRISIIALIVSIISIALSVIFKIF
jgi:hypothetical protein